MWCSSGYIAQVRKTLVVFSLYVQKDAKNRTILKGILNKVTGQGQTGLEVKQII